MRALFSAFLFFLTALQLSAQSTDIKYGKAKIIQPFFKEPLKGLLPFKKIIVVDSRFDTSKLGYVKEVKYYRGLRTPTSFAEDMQTAMNERFSSHYNASSENVIFLYIKHVWLQETTMNEESNNKLVQNVYEPKSNFTACKALFECYLQKDSSYIPLIRFDSTFKSNLSLREVADELLALPFQTVLERLSAIDLNKKRKQMSKQEMQVFNYRYFNYPRMQKDSISKGIYLSFADFLANKVSGSSFEVIFGKLTDELYLIDENGERKLLREFWGFCDGKKQFINTGLNLFELKRVGNTYEYFGFKTVVDFLRSPEFRPVSGGGPVDIMTAGLLAGLSKAKNIDRVTRLLQINMETGKPY